LNLTYKVFAKILYDRLLPRVNAAVQHYQAGFQSGKSTTDQFFALHIGREAAKVGLKINEQKTKYMIAARNHRTIREVGQSVAIGDKHFNEIVKEFVYVGSLMTPTNDVSLKIQRRIQTANRCFFALRKHLHSSHLSRQAKFTIHKTLIRPVLLYGSETWLLTKREARI
jgi:hypothetical protein